MSLANLFIEIPKCPEHKEPFHSKVIMIKLKDGKNYSESVYYCPKCNEYSGRNGMEKDVRKVGLDFLNRYNPNYTDSDIISIITRN